MWQGEGFEEWASGNWTTLLGLARLITGDSAVADDVLQDTLVDMYSRWDRIQGSGSLLGYSAQVMTSKVANRRRTAWARRVGVSDTMDMFDGPTGRDMSRSDDYLDIVEALQSLNPRQREVVAMHYLLDMPVADVAASLNRPVGSITSDLTRARKALRETLALDTGAP